MWGLCLLIVSLPQNGLAQRLRAAELPEAVTVGRRASDGAPVPALRYRPGGRIVRFHVDSVGQTLTLFARATDKKERYYKPTGRVLQYDLATGDTLWTRSMNFVTEDYDQEGSTMLFWDGKTTTQLDARTRRRGWTAKTPIATLTAGGRVALSYAAAAGKEKDRLRGLDAATGEERWSRDVPREYGWDTFRELSDSALVVVAGGLHYVNPLTGAGWSTVSQTGERNAGATAGKALLAVVTGVVAGVSMVPTDVDRTYGFVSNVVAGGGGFTYASADTLHSYDLDGTRRWATRLPAEQPSATIVMTIGDAYVLVSTGCARKNGASVPHGSIYVAGFDTLTGARRFLRHLDQGRKSQVDALIRQGDGVIVKVGSVYYRIAGATGEIEVQRELTPGEASAAGGFASATLFRREGERFVSCREEETDALYVILAGGDLALLTEDLRLGERVKAAALLRWIGVSGEKRLLSDGKDCILVDAEGLEVMRVPGGLGSRLVGGKVYAISADELVVAGVE